MQMPMVIMAKGSEKEKPVGGQGAISLEVRKVNPAKNQQPQ